MTFYIKTKKELKTYFSEEYYNSINYVDYTNRVLKYNKTALDLKNYFNIDGDDNILDYGCAVGMLLNGFKKLKLDNLCGYDTSEWAVSNAIDNGLKITADDNILKNKYDYIISLDVFEHIFDDDISTVLNILDTKKLIIRIPVKQSEDSDFYLDVSRRDKSHINCKTKDEWIDFIESFGFIFKSTIATETMYDSKGCFCGYFTKG